MAIELEANKGYSEVLKSMVDRRMVRREELAKLHKSIHAEGGVGIGLNWVMIRLISGIRLCR